MSIEKFLGVEVFPPKSGLPKEEQVEKLLAEFESI